MDKKRKVVLGSFVVLTSVFVLFLIKGFIFLDPDFGWRLRTGEMILTSGIPKSDPFSYTMSTFAWVDHAWSLSTLIYILKLLTGFWGLSLVFSLITLSILVTSSRIKTLLTKTKVFAQTNLVLGIPRTSLILALPVNFTSLGYFAALPVILTTSILFTFFGVRAQIVSWLMLAIVLFILFDERKWEKRRFLLPLIFLVWANLHGSFVMGLETFAIFVFFRFLRTKKLEVNELLLFLVSVLLTLLNPYGSGIWKEAYSSISDSSLRFRIIEWMPALMMVNFPMIFFMGFSGAILFKYRSKFSLEEKGLFVVFLLQALLSRRHLPLWAIVALPITMQGIYFVWLEASRNKGGVLRFAKMYVACWVFAVILFFSQLFLSLREAQFLGQGGFYPKEAVTYLRQNLPEGQIFSEYGWGGYLIWNLPEKKVFIDGRMPSWRWDAKNENELNSAFDVYEDIQRGKVDYKEVFAQFNVTTVLWSKPKKTTPVDNFFKGLEKYLEVFGWEQNDFDLVSSLEKDGWGKIYEDTTAVIYRKPQ